MIMEKQEDTQIYRGGVFCVSVVLPLEQIAMRLDGEHMEKKVAADGVQIRLPEDSYATTCPMSGQRNNVTPCYSTVLLVSQYLSFPW